MFFLEKYLSPMLAQYSCHGDKDEFLIKGWIWTKHVSIVINFISIPGFLVWGYLDMVESQNVSAPGLPGFGNVKIPKPLRKKPVCEGIYFVPVVESRHNWWLFHYVLIKIYFLPEKKSHDWPLVWTLHAGSTVTGMNYGGWFRSLCVSWIGWEYV